MSEMVVYAVFREGVYRHECGGVFSTYELAEKAALELAAAEGDRYHDLVVVPFGLDVITPAMNDGFRNCLDEPGEVFRTKKQT